MRNEPEAQNNTLQDCIRRFEELDIAYMLTGSMALVHYAMPRMTADIDIVINIDSAEVEKIIKAFEPDYYVPHETARQAVFKRSMFNLLHQKSLIKVDCIVGKNDEYQKLAFSRRAKVNYTGEFEVWIINREDLILSKLNWAKMNNSEMQLRDAANVLRNGYDEDYVEKWAQRIGVDDFLQKALKMLK